MRPIRSGRSAMHLAWCIVLLGPLLVPLSTARAEVPPTPRWDHDARMSSKDGYAQLSWTVEDDSVHWVYQLEEGRLPGFEDTILRHEGPQHSSFVSGLEDGTSYFRVRARHPDRPDGWSEWSQTLEIEVQHYSRSFALTLMGIGAVVFLATATFLIVHRNDPTPHARSSR